MKLVHNDKVALAWAILVEIVVHGIFALGAFLMGGFLGDIALSHIFGPAGTKIGAYGLAIFVFCAAFQAFVLGEYMKEHVSAFERTSRGDGSYMKSWKETRILVGAIELCSLAFRCIVVAQQDDYGQLIVTLIFGIAALRYAYAQAKVIHASVNRPIEYDVYQAQQEVGHDLVKDVVGSSRYMTPEEKYAFLGGDVSGATAAQQRKPKGLIESWRERGQQKREQERERGRQQEEEFMRSRDTANRIVPTYDPFPKAQRNTQQSDPLSQSNGHRN